MTLQDISPRLEPISLPGSVTSFLNDCDERIQSFVSERADGRYPSFVPSDYPEVYGVLRHILDRGLASGQLLCEWGSGFGVVAALASLLEFEAWGIEIEEELVEESLQLAEDHELSVQYVHGNFIPHGGEICCEQYSNDFSWLSLEGEDAHEKMGLDPSDFDVIFAYPWPAEAPAIFSLFEDFAARGALLVTYHGFEGFRVQRKPF